MSRYECEYGYFSTHPALTCIIYVFMVFLMILLFYKNTHCTKKIHVYHLSLMFILYSHFNLFSFKAIFYVSKSEQFNPLKKLYDIL